MSAVCTQGVGQAEKDGRWVKVAIAFMPTLAVELGNAWAPLNFQGQMVLDSTRAPALLAGLPTINPNDIVPRQASSAPATPSSCTAGWPPDEINPDYKNYNLAGATGLRPPIGGGPIVNNDTGSRGDGSGHCSRSRSRRRGSSAVPPDNLVGTAPGLV